jgi:hypothetical protein
MKYLRSGRKKRIQEKELRKINAVVDSDLDTELFDDTDCTMNRICHYMEKCIANIDMDINTEDEFHWENLLPYIPDITSHGYKKIRDKLEEMQEWLYEINNARCKDTDDSEEAAKENNRNYDALYELAKSEFLGIVPDTSKLLDMLLVIFYSDKKFMKEHSDKSILWGCFGNELMERARSGFSHEGDTEMDQIRKRGEKARKSLESVHEYREKNYQVWEFDNDKNADRKVTIYKEDIRWIKKKVPAKQERCTDCRRLLLVLLYICRKCDSNTITVLCNKNNRITKSVLCKMADIDARNFNEVVRILQDLRILDAGIDKYNHLSLKMNEINMDGNEILAEDILYRKLKSIAKDKIREKVSSSVKNNCA